MLLRVATGIAVPGLALVFLAPWHPSAAPRRPGLRLEPGTYTLAAGVDRIGVIPIAVDVVNETDEPVRIEGIDETCGMVCFHEAGPPVTIPSRGRGRVAALMTADTPGMISESLQFLTDRADPKSLTLRIEGEVGAGPVAEPGTPNR